ncbi:MAG: J domain-containing protein [Chloroflexi bacterium]|nr:J domain-containing protein [Chloroflexota bacterium]
MTREIAKRPTPEEAELGRKRAELAALEATLAQRELDLATLQGELQAFERRYLRIVGLRLAQLDELQARIAEAEAARRPRDPGAEERASRARAQAQESAEAAGQAREPGPEDARFEPSEGLRKLFREVAKQVHPDLATDDAERARRTRLMAEANDAYRAGDEARLQAILSRWEASPEAVKGEGVAAELVRVIRKIAQVEERLRAIDAELARLKATDLYQLKAKVDEAEQQGRDLLADMAAAVDDDIAAARTRLEALTAQRAET